MKSTVIAFFILALMAGTAVVLSNAQESALSEIRESLDNLSDDPTATLSKAIDDFKNMKFNLELSIPSDEHDRILHLLKSSLFSLENGETALFHSFLAQSKIYLDSMIEYCNITLQNIL